MNISADGILGTAQKINQKRISAKNNQQSDAARGREDSVQIGSRLSGRLPAIQQDLREVQDSLSRNQVIRDGLSQLREDFQSGGNNVRMILADVQYNSRPVLQEFLGNETITGEFLTSRMNENTRMINDDVNRLSRLQVETENIFASSLVPNTADLSQDIAGSGRPESISNLNADVVMRLTR
ncbi:MAG: hypothetical protein ACOC2H_07560 [Spirochaetota bacterium]